MRATNLLLLLPALSGAACAHRSPAAPPASPVVIDPAPPVSPAQPDPPPLTPVYFCQIHEGGLSTIIADYDAATGDTLYHGRRLREMFPVTPQPAAAAAWYVGNEPIVVRGRRFLKYGLPRQLNADDLVPSGEYQGLRYFAERGDRDPLIVYLAVSSNCEFQTYQVAEIGGAVRGL
jgi:hypothetical protein